MASDGAAPPCYYCSRRDVYIEIDSQADEKSPLLSKWGRASFYDPSIISSTVAYSSPSTSELNFGKHKNREKVWTLQLVAIAILVLFGFSIASYLLAVDNRLPPIRFVLDLVTRDVWSTVDALPLMEPLDPSKVAKVLLMQTGGQGCNEDLECVRMIRAMQSKHLQTHKTEIPFNFLIGGKGQTYEVRGWEYAHGFPFLPQNSALVFGFIGNFTTRSPSSDQLQNALSLIKESIRRQKLLNNYLLYTVRNLTISHLDGEELFSRVAAWPNFDEMLKIL